MSDEGKNIQQIMHVLEGILSGNLTSLLYDTFLLNYLLVHA